MRIPVTDEMRSLLDGRGTCVFTVTSGVDPGTGEWQPVAVVHCAACGQDPEIGAAAGCRTCLARSVLTG